MMNPKALEALKQARELFRQPAEVAKDDIPEEVTQVFSEPLRKPRVVLLPPDAPKFDQHSMKKEHKQMEQPKQIDKYVEMSVMQAVKSCVAKGIKKPADIAKETGKKPNQIYTQLWKLKQQKRKARLEAKAAVKQPTPKQQADEWGREPTPFEDAHMVVLKNREQYEAEIAKLVEENLELKAVIKYLERKVSNV